MDTEGFKKAMVDALAEAGFGLVIGGDYIFLSRRKPADYSGPDLGTGIRISTTDGLAVLTALENSPLRRLFSPLYHTARLALGI